MRVHIHRLEGQDARREQLLALQPLPVGLESYAPGGACGLGQMSTMAAGDGARTLRELYELVAALDRRVPHVERAGELAIASAAAALRSEAVSRIGAIEAGSAPSGTEES